MPDGRPIDVMIPFHAEEIMTLDAPLLRRLRGVAGGPA